MITDFKIPRIPPRPVWAITEKEKLALAASLFLPATNADLYRAFVEPTATSRRCTAMAVQLFSSPDAQEYLELLKSALNRSWFGIQDKNNPQGKLSKEEKIAQAKEAVEDLILERAQDPETEDLSKYIDRFYKIFVGDEERGEEPPRRYLPQICGTVVKGEEQNDGKVCRYKYFCETNCEDECPICRYRDFALKNGCQTFSHKDQLDINLLHPQRIREKEQEVIEDIF